MKQKNFNMTDIMNSTAKELKKFTGKNDVQLDREIRKKMDGARQKDIHSMLCQLYDVKNK